jgi:hypothetical protein
LVKPVRISSRLVTSKQSLSAGPVSGSAAEQASKSVVRNTSVPVLP